MKDELEGIIRENISRDRSLKKTVQKTLKSHAESYYQLETAKSRKKEDKHAYDFIHTVYFGDMYTVEKYLNFYDRLKRRFDNNKSK